MRYAEMKDSGIPWIGDIPKHWNTIKLKYASWLKGRIGWQGLKSNEYTDNGPYLITGTDFDNGTINWTSCAHISEERFYEDSDIHIKENDLLITKDGTIGKVAIAKHCPPMVSLNSGVMLIRNTRRFKYYDQYLYYILLSNQFLIWYEMSQNGASTIKHLYQEQFYNFCFSFPPLAEQKTIATYLDEKCGAIDKIIAEAKATIEEYKAWKTSVIFEAVTKGLDPNAEMKDSGVEWIGLIPKHWKKRKIKKVCKLKTGTTPDTKHLEWFDGDVKWYTPTDFSELYYLAESKRSLSKQAIKDMVATVIPQDSILFVGIGATAGKVGYSSYECSINQQITALIPTENIYPKYLMFFLISISKTVRELANYTTLPIINNTTLGIFDALLPPHPEQAAIADYLDKQCATIDGIITEKQTLIDELETYKKSLIFETVTGKRSVC